MIKKTITFEDYNGQSVTEDFYFNLSKIELIEMEVQNPEGLVKVLQEIVKSNDPRRIIEEFQKIIKLSYGKKSPDGKRFIKNQEILEEFTQTEAYSELFLELSTEADAAAQFVQGIMPKGMDAGSATTEVELPGVGPDEEVSDEELLKMNPIEMTKEQLQRAYALRNAQR